MVVVWTVLALLAGLTVLVFLIGSLLPELYEGRAERLLSRPCPEVWNAVADYSTNPVGGRMTRACKPFPPEAGDGAGDESEAEAKDGAGDLPRWIEDMGATRTEVVTVGQEPPRRVVREMTDLVVPLTARWELDLEPVGEKRTRVTLTNAVTVRRGTWHVPLFRVLMTLSKGVEKGCAHYLQRLEANLGSHSAADS